LNVFSLLFHHSIASACLAMSACTAKQSPASLSGVWKLTSYGFANAPTPAVADTESGLTFNEDGTLTGNSGCNGFGRSYTVDGDRITFKDIVSTLSGETMSLTNNDMVLALAK
jgi:heat shock protein HslJ